MLVRWSSSHSVNVFKIVLPAGIAPAASAFAQRRSDLLSFGSNEKKGPLGRICTRTGSLLRRVSLLLDYKGMWEMKSPFGGICTRTGSCLRRASLLLDYKGIESLVPVVGLAPALNRF